MRQGRHFAGRKSRQNSRCDSRTGSGELERLEPRVLLTAAVLTRLAKFHVIADVATMKKQAKLVANASGASLYGAIDGFANRSTASLDSHPTAASGFSVDATGIRAFLANAPLEFTKAAANPLVLDIPMPNGTFSRFNIVEAPIMEPGLAKKFPAIKTYRGQGIDDPSATVRLDITPLGFHAQILSPNGAVYVEPYFHLDQSTYLSYYKRDNQQATPWDCFTTDDDSLATKSTKTSSSTATPHGTTLPLDTTNGTTLKTYRLACAADAEYTAFFGGTVSAGQAAVVTAINRVTGVYETELAIRMTLVANNSNIIFTNSSTDPYTNNNGSTMLTQNQTTCDNVSFIGSANYDIGHVFSTGGGGVAFLGVVGASGNKAKGVTGNPSPTGDSFWIDYVAHEMGHEFGGNHTFNSSTSNCGGGNRNAATAYEQGSGSTIMAYAGICGADDLQPHSDPYFHTKSVDEIVAYTSSGNGFNSAVKTATNNNPPVIAALTNYTIPANSFFFLTTTATDPDNDPLTYYWEQRDLGPSTLVTTPDNGSSPLFRDWVPTTSPTRYFRRLSDIINNTSAVGEIMPTTARTMHYRVTARDNKAGGGALSTADMTVTTVVTSGSFTVTAPNTAVTWTGGQTQPVTWNVAGTDANGINTANVNILLSLDGGNTYPITLASNTPNDGSQNITVPFNTGSTTARVMVQGASNIFFDISNANFTVINVPVTTAAPQQPVLQAGSDTGTSSSDGITKKNNSNAGNALTFDIGGTISGADVRLYADGTQIGSGTGNGGTLSITSTGAFTLNDTSHNITARQTDTVGGLPQSADSSALSITVDTTAPTIIPQSLPAFGFGGAHNFTITFSENLATSISQLGGASLGMFNNTTSTAVAGGSISVAYTAGTKTAVYTFPGLANGRLTDGAYTATSSATDAAGNAPTAAYNFIFAGGTTAHTAYLRRSSGGGVNDEVYVNTLPDGSPDIVSTFATLNQVAFEGSTSDDIFTVDYVNGTPIPSGFQAFRFVGRSGNDIFNALNTGTFVFGSDPAVDTDTLTVNSQSGATVEFDSSRVHVAAINLDAGNVVVPASGSAVVLTTALSIINGGKFDLFDNDMIVNYPAGPSPYASIAAAVLSARAGGAWTGGGLTSTTAKNANPKNTTIGVLEGSDYKNIFGAGATFDSESFDTTTVLIKYTYYGDTDLSGRVDFDDYQKTDQGFNLNKTGWLNGDFNGDGRVDFDDYLLIDQAFNTQSGVL